MIKLVKTQIRRFTADEEGVAAIEYALIAAATGLSLAVTLPGLSSALNSTWTAIAGYLGSV